MVEIPDNQQFQSPKLPSTITPMGWPDQSTTIDFSIEPDINITRNPTGPVIRQPGIRIVSSSEKDVTICQVPYDKEKINVQARKYADQGKKLSLGDGSHFTWDSCFNMLDFIRTLVVNVATTV